MTSSKQEAATRRHNGERQAIRRRLKEVPRARSRWGLKEEISEEEGLDDAIHHLLLVSPQRIGRRRIGQEGGYWLATRLFLIFAKPPLQLEMEERSRERQPLRRGAASRRGAAA
ncbi:unnamed protein product [Linum trigynum]|uniref:Uncharacterized protein n=1 Tax=Linum trigynum TaxID=586398 RepID=A0AAV2D620_9ROSI